ncbi:MAG: 30S ribosomal protein S6e [archaeon]
MGIKFVIADAKTAKCYQKEVDVSKISSLIGSKVADEFDGGIIDIPGYKLKITGGSGKGGFPMKKGIIGSAVQPVLLSFGPGMRSKMDGLRRRKTVCGAAVSRDVSQVNVKVVKYGKQSLDSIFGIAGKAKEVKSE